MLDYRNSIAPAISSCIEQNRSSFVFNTRSRFIDQREGRLDTHTFADALPSSHCVKHRT